MKTVFFNGQEIGEADNWDEARAALNLFINNHVFELFPIVPMDQRHAIFCHLYRHPAEKSFTASDVAVETATNFQIWPCGLHQVHDLMTSFGDITKMKRA
jgi:peptidoglycan/xylan/chitin deacetylase (PgdA/CDA1 family)